MVAARTTTKASNNSKVKAVATNVNSPGKNLDNQQGDRGRNTNIKDNENAGDEKGLMSATKNQAQSQGQ